MVHCHCLLFAVLIAFLLSVNVAEGADSCDDVIPNCRSYGQSVCVDYGDWAKINCKATCQFCSGASKPKPCQDNVDDCAKYASDLCTNDKYKVWAEDNCFKFCGFCIITSTSATTPTTTTTTTTTPSTTKLTQASMQTTSSATATTPCADALNFCFAYSKKACSDVTWANKYCRKMCSRC